MRIILFSHFSLFSSNLRTVFVPVLLRIAVVPLLLLTLFHTAIISKQTRYPLYYYAARFSQVSTHVSTFRLSFASCMIHPAILIDTMQRIKRGQMSSSSQTNSFFNHIYPLHLISRHSFPFIFLVIPTRSR